MDSKNLTVEEVRARNRRYQRTWYATHLEAKRRHNLDRRRRLSLWLADLKTQKSCRQCGERRPATLDFHHRDGTRKDIEIAKAPMRGWSRERILAEIAKCDVLCANCHRVLHA